MPSVAVHVVEFTFSRGFESYLRSQSLQALALSAFPNWDTLGHVALAGFVKTPCCIAKIARVRELIAARTLSGICCTYTSAVVLMLARRKAPCASLYWQALLSALEVNATECAASILLRISSRR